MPPRIRDIRIEQRRLNLAEAELLVTVEVDGGGPATEVRGRWVGPRCAGRSTVDVAYPMQPLPADATQPGQRFRVIILEPAMWSAGTPFLYDATIELWDAGQRVERRVSEHGFRMPGGQ